MSRVRRWKALRGGMILVLCAFGTLGQSCGGPVEPTPDPTPDPNPTPDPMPDPAPDPDPDPAPPDVTACGLFARDCVPLSGARPIVLVAGDLDEDGDIDLVVGNESSENIIVLLNAGDATFVEGVVRQANRNLEAMALGDLDADGDLDVLIDAIAAGEYFLNDGTGAFDEGVELTQDTLGVSIDVDLADANSDGLLDLIVTESDPDAIMVVLNQGSLSFSEPMRSTNLPTGIIPRHSAPADLDGDDRVDVVVIGPTGSGVGNVGILRGDGEGSFAAGPILEVGQSLNHVIGVDVDDDGDQDLVVSDLGSVFTTEAGLGAVWLLENNGAAQFGDARLLLSDTGADSSIPGDWNGDGAIDLAVIDAVSNEAILLTNLDGVFMETQRLGVGTEPDFILAADFDDDGDEDLAIANAGSDSVSILLNDGTGSFTRTED